jgi:hypothetical protein
MEVLEDRRRAITSGVREQLLKRSDVMSNCLFGAATPGLIGLIAGAVVGVILSLGSRLRSPSDRNVDERMGRAILGVCMLLGGAAGLLVQAYVTGACGGS